MPRCAQRGLTIRPFSYNQPLCREVVPDRRSHVCRSRPPPLPPCFSLLERYSRSRLSSSAPSSVSSSAEGAASDLATPRPETWGRLALVLCSVDNLAVEKMDPPLGVIGVARVVGHHTNRRALGVEPGEELHHCPAVLRVDGLISCRLSRGRPSLVGSIATLEAEPRDVSSGQGPYWPCTTMLLRVPTPEISISYTSPGSIARVLPIVPDQIRSPGSRVKYVEM
jgi:hypothetical protein